MKIHWKLAFICSALIPIALSVLLFRSYRLIEKDKTEFEIESLSQKGSLLRRLAQESLKRIDGVLTQIAAAPTHNANTEFSTQSLFAATAQLGRDSKGLWQIERSRRNSHLSIQTWPAGYEDTLFKSVLAGEMNTDELFWFRASDPQGKSRFIVAKFQSGKLDSAVKIFAAILEKNPLADVLDDLRGTYIKAFIYDQKGFGVAHVDRDLEGQLLSENSVVRDSLRRRQVVASGTYELDDKQSVFGYFSKIAGSNLILALSAPRTKALALAHQFFKLFTMVGCGLALMVFVVSYLFGLTYSRRLKILQRFAEHLAGGEYNLQLLAKSKDELGELAVRLNKVKSRLISEKSHLHQVEQQEAQAKKIYETMSAGVGVSIRTPIALILAQVQIMKKKNRDERIESGLVSVESEARHIKEIVERLVRFSGVEKFELSEIKVQDTLKRLTELRGERWRKLGIQPEIHIDDVPAILGHSVYLTKAFENILQNAEEALSQVDSKVLKISLTQTESSVKLLIQDSGLGMTSETKHKIFDPFFSLKGEGHLGLGMALVFGVARELGATVQVESQAGHGTQIFFEFPLRTLSTAPTTAIINALSSVANSASDDVFVTATNSTPAASSVDVAFAAIKPIDARQIFDKVPLKSDAVANAFKADHPAPPLNDSTQFKLRRPRVKGKKVDESTRSI